MKFYIGTGFKNCEIVNYMSKKLIERGWEHTYNWAENIIGDESIEDLVRYSLLEQQAINNSDIVIIILPAGRGTHVELGMALALNKKIYLCSMDDKDFNSENSVNFYHHPDIKKIVGDVDNIISKIIKDI